MKKISVKKGAALAMLLVAGYAFMSCSHSSDSSEDTVQENKDDSGNSGSGVIDADGTDGSKSEVTPEDNPSSDTPSSDNPGSNNNSTIPSNQVTPGGTEATAVMDTPTVADVANATVNIVKSEGWLNSAYIIFEQVEGATYEVLCDDVEIDSALIRYYDTYTYYENPTDNDGQTSWEKKTLSKVVRADALGLKAGSHTIKVCAVGTENTSEYSTATMTVVDQNRSGFAFAPSATTTPGAYNKDGTLKDNAIVLYVTGATAKTVSYTQEKGKNATANATYTGLQSILSESSLKKLTVPLDIRIIGTINKDQMDSLGSSEEGLQIKTTTDCGVTIEGVGHDAAIYGFGVLIRNAKYVELANLGLYNFMDDGISVDTDNSYLWIHNNDISYGAVGSDSDQAKGDGSLDFKKSTYSTLSYNHFWDSGKCNLLDASEHSSGGSNYLSYHHNWYDHSDSRHPRIRNAKAVHVYNNYYDGNSKYGVGVTTGSSAFVEGNYFRNAHDPMMSSKQGTDAQGNGTFSGESGGVIKAYNNKFAQNNTNGVKFQYITNKYDYTNNTELGEYKEWYETVGTENSDGTWTIYDSVVTSSDDTIATNSLITIEDATKKGAYYQGSKEKTMFYLDVPANTTKVIIKAKTGSSTSGATTTLTVNGVKSDSIGNTAYADFEFDISGLTKDSTISVTNSGSSSLNISEIKVIASSGWQTKLTSGADLTNIDAYEVDDRSEQVPAIVMTKSGGYQYSNFDVALGDSGMGVTIAVTDPDQAKSDVMLYAGRHNPDFAYQFTNSTDDANYSVNSELKALVVGYTSGLTATQGTSASSSETPTTPDDPETPETPDTPATPAEGVAASLTFNSDSALSAESAGTTFTVAGDAMDFYPSTGKVKVSKVNGKFSISFKTPGTTTDKYSMVISYFNVKTDVSELEVKSGETSVAKIAISASAGKQGSKSDLTGTTVNTSAVELAGGTEYTITRSGSKEFGLVSITITSAE